LDIGKSRNVKQQRQSKKRHVAPRDEEKRQKRRDRGRGRRGDKESEDNDSNDKTRQGKTRERFEATPVLPIVLISFVAIS
jgi:hypothetical protein